MIILYCEHSKNTLEGWGSSSVVVHLPGMCEVLDLSLSTAYKQIKVYQQQQQQQNTNKPKKNTLELPVWRRALLCRIFRIGDVLQYFQSINRQIS